MPTVSIVVPMYNAEAFVTKTLHSILQEQTVDLEVIVVNDRSTDRSLQRVFGDWRQARSESSLDQVKAFLPV